jgi:N-methylhydantoinase A
VSGGFRLAADIGGTFTDIVLLAPDGHAFTRKVLSTVDDYARGIVDALVGLLHDARLPVGDLAEVLHATTVGSNAVLEHGGARTGLITTRGFRDVLEIRDLRMPRLYDQAWEKPAPLVPRRWRVEVAERTRGDGTIAEALDEEGVHAALDFLLEEGVESLAVCLLNAHANGAHEQRIGEIARLRAPHIPVCLSHQVLPQISEYPRTSTAVINAYVLPVVSSYLARLRERLDAAGVGAPIAVMQSNGGLMDAAQAARLPMTLIESGPAAGAIAARALARALDLDAAIGFDMGGTTAKATLIEEFDVFRAAEMQVGGGIMLAGRLLTGAGYTLRTAAIDLAEVGAGGGSIVAVDAAGAPSVGPASAGAMPGPACYARGGEKPTITDCNLLLGYLPESGLAGGAVPLDRARAEAALAPVAARLGLSLHEAAWGLFRIATANMMRAVRAVSTERGRDARSHALIAFGGNGPLFGAALAEAAGQRRVIIPPGPGLFSAFGLLFAEVEHHVARSFRARADALDFAALEAAFTTLEAEAGGRLAANGFAPDRQAFVRSVNARYVGQNSDLPVALPKGATDVASRFAAEHARTYGYAAPESEPVEVVGLSLVGRGIAESPPAPGRLLLDGHPPVAQARRRAFFGHWVEAEVLSRADLGAPRTGPMIIEEYDATCLVPPGWRAHRDAMGNIVLEHQP